LKLIAFISAYQQNAMNPSSIVIVCAGFLAVMAVAVSGQGAAQCQKDGKSYDIGAMFDGTDAFFFCKRDGSNVKAEAIGCISNGQRVYDLALYAKGDSFYRCRAQETTVSSDLWGCAYKEGGAVTPKSLACTWDVGNYVNTCVRSGDSAVIKQIYCLYTYRGGRIQINDGCYRVFPDAGVAAGCKRNSDGSTLTMTTWPSKNAATDPQAPACPSAPLKADRDRSGLRI